MIVTVKCLGCGKQFKAGRKDVKTCSNKCRSKVHREKYKLVMKQQKVLKATCSRCGELYPASDLSYICVDDGKVWNGELTCYECALKWVVERNGRGSKDIPALRKRNRDQGATVKQSDARQSLR